MRASVLRAEMRENSSCWATQESSCEVLIWVAAGKLHNKRPTRGLEASGVVEEKEALIRLAQRRNAADIAQATRDGLVG